MDLLLKLTLLLTVFIAGLIAGRTDKHLKPSHVSNLLLFNIGRFLSYFAGGVIVGLAGFLVKINGFNGGIILFIFAFGILVVTLSHMKVIPSLLILGLHGHHHPKKSFPAGLLNVFASSITLHIVILISLAHGYYIESGLIMLAFALGSIYLPNKKVYIHNKLVDSLHIIFFLVSALFIINKGLLYTQLYLFTPFESKKTALVPEVLDQYQYLKTDIHDLDKRILIGDKNELNWMITGDKKKETIYIPYFRHKSKLNGEYEFLSIKPERSKFIYFTLGLGRGDHVIKIIDNIRDVYDLPYNVVLDSGFGDDLCNENSIPTEFTNRPNIIISEPGIALIDNDGQNIDIKITENGYEPSIIVLKKGLSANLNFIGSELTKENYRVVMPSFNEYIEFKEGNNIINIPSPLVDFIFYSWKGEHGGYILVVDDLSNMTKDKAERQIRMLNVNGI